MRVDRPVLRAVRPQRRDLPIAPWRDVDHEIGTGFGAKVCRARGIPWAERRRPEQPPDGVRRPEVGKPPMVGRSRYCIAREPADREMVDVAIEAVGIERSDDGRAISPELSDQLISDRRWIRSGELTIAITEHVDIGDSDSRCRVAELDFARGTHVGRRPADRRIAGLSRFSARGADEYDADPASLAPAGQARAREALVVRMRKAEEERRRHESTRYTVCDRMR